MARNENYEEFVDKFKTKLTTDDCYTPENITESRQQPPPIPTEMMKVAVALIYAAATQEK